MITEDRINKIKQEINIRVILDDFAVPRNNRVCRCPNPEHEDKNPSCRIQDADGERYPHPSVYCYTESMRWDNINLYIMLKGYDRRKDFIKAIVEMEERYFDEHITTEINDKAKLIYISDARSSKRRIDIDVLLDNKIPDLKITKWTDIINGESVLEQYLFARGIDFDRIIESLNFSGVNIYHLHDTKYRSNYICYLCTKNNGEKFIVRKRLDGYLPENKNKIIKNIQGNIGSPEPVWITPVKSNNKLVICEGMEDGLSLLMLDYNITVVVLNSISLINKFTEQFSTVKNNFHNYKIIIAMDNDKEGTKAANKLSKYFLELGYTDNINLFRYQFIYNSKDINADWVYYLKNNQDAAIKYLGRCM